MSVISHLNEAFTSRSIPNHRLDRQGTILSTTSTPISTLSTATLSVYPIKTKAADS